MSLSPEDSSDSVQPEHSGEKNNSLREALFPSAGGVEIIAPDSESENAPPLMDRACAALEKGRHLLLPAIAGFSASEERVLKSTALEKNLLVLGPGSSLVLFGDFSFGVQSAIGRGRGIGVVGTDGGAIHELTSLASDHYGASVTAAIDVGARDLSNSVGGLMTECVLKTLAADPETEVICLTAYMPSEEVRTHLCEVISGLGKPAVIRWLGEFSSPHLSPEVPPPSAGGIFFASDIDEAAQAAALLAAHKPLEFRKSCSKCVTCMKAEKLRDGKNLPRRLVWIFGNGALAAEAAGFLRSRGMNISMPLFPLSEEGPVESPGNLAVDAALGTDAFGAAHPALSIQRRTALIRKAASDKSVGAVFFDVTLGKGAHDNPAPLFIEAVRSGLADRYKDEMRGNTADAVPDGRKNDSEGSSMGDILIMASITGTAADSQDFAAQKALLRGAGIAVAPTSAKAARIASELFVP